MCWLVSKLKSWYYIIVHDVLLLNTTYFLVFRYLLIVMQTPSAAGMSAARDRLSLCLRLIDTESDSDSVDCEWHSDTDRKEKNYRYSCKCKLLKLQFSEMNTNSTILLHVGWKCKHWRRLNATINTEVQELQYKWMFSEDLNLPRIQYLEEILAWQQLLKSPNIHRSMRNKLFRLV